MHIRISDQMSSNYYSRFLYLGLLLPMLALKAFSFLEQEQQQQQQQQQQQRIFKMPLRMVDATISSFSEVFGKFVSDAPNRQASLILFLADKEPSTNLSWCPDCVRAEPVIYNKLEASSVNVCLLRVYVGDRPTWRNSQNPFRTDTRFNLKGVPTLVRWENDAVNGRLEDHEAHIVHKIEALITGN